MSFARSFARASAMVRLVSSGGFAAVRYLVRALLHGHRRDRRHGFDAIDIHFGKLLDETENAVQLANHAVCLFFGDGNTSKARNALNGGKVDGHDILRMGFSYSL
jgi:hypothetical protein